MIFLLWVLLRLMRLRGLLITGVLILVIGIAALTFPDSTHLVLGIGLAVIGVIAVVELLRR